MSDTELQPDTTEVLQAEHDYAYATVPVCVQEIQSPVRVQALPRRGGATRTRTVDALTPVRLLTANARRGQVTLMSLDQNMYVALDKASSTDASSMSLWPKLVPLVITAATEVWVLAATATTQVSVTAEFWAEAA